jgi:hypothetical protein
MSELILLKNWRLGTKVVDRMEKVIGRIHIIDHLDEIIRI